jgi:hypothetical protein
MLNSILSGGNVGVAARYTAQIRELLAMLETHNAQRVAEAGKASEAPVQSRANTPLGTVVDVQA